MNAECVLDTNVLVYAVSNLADDRVKRDKALDLIADGPFGVSGQILQEFYVNVTRKIRKKLPADEALAWVTQFARQPCVAIDAAIVMRAAEISERFKISYWDGTIIAAAERLGAGTLYSEDLSDGQMYGSVRAVDPFGSST